MAHDVVGHEPLATAATFPVHVATNRITTLSFRIHKCRRKLRLTRRQISIVSEDDVLVTIHQLPLLLSELDFNIKFTCSFASNKTATSQWPTWSSWPSCALPLKALWQWVQQWLPPHLQLDRAASAHIRHHKYNEKSATWNLAC